LFLFNTWMSGQENVKQEGYTILYYPNGKILSEGYLKNGKPEGYWKTYYTTGILKSEGSRKNFQLDSTWIFYNSTGDTISKINYLNGRKNGYYYEFNTNRSSPEFIGKIKSKELFVNDVKQGKSYYYFENGQLREESNYSNDYLDGLSIEFDKDGRIITIKKYSKGSLIERQKINRFDEQGLKTGEWISFYEGIKIKSVSNYKEDQLNGYYKEYTFQGKLVLTLLYENGRLVEEVKDEQRELIEKEIRNENGSITRGPYLKDIPVGIHKTRSIDGEIVNSKIYNNLGVLLSEGIIDKEGKRIGEWKDFYEDGSIRCQGSYKNNRREGKWLFYFEDGNVEQIGNYLNGLEHGEWKRYYSGGEIFVEEAFYNGKEEGSYTEYDINGNVIAKGEFLEGEQEGEWITTINDFRAEGKYIVGLKDGKWRFYYDDGNILFEGDYIQGNPDGRHRYYYPDGVLKEDQFYSSGMPDKNWKKFDQNGNLVVTVSYKDGMEYRINGVKIDFPDENKVIIK
jgi:uncharacterized protein